MVGTYQSYSAFISSPKDVKEERQIAENTINRINRNCIETLRLSLDVRKWEYLTLQAPRLPEERIQDMLNKEVEKANFFILILFKRYGSIEKGYTLSNTEREINTILRIFERKPQIKILAYFRNIPQNDDPGDQEQKVQELRQRLQSLNVLCKSYENPEDFKEILTHDLYDVIMRMQLSSYKQYRLQNFWRFGISERPTDPRLAIVYPSVQREYMGSPDNEDLWLKRLEPNIYFEDYKAIQKLHKVLNMIGFSDYSIFPHTDLPPEIKFMNRIWLCFPRLKAAHEQFKKYRNSARFNFIPRSQRRNGAIEWSNNTGTMIVRSPLGKYLREQRKKMDISGEWHSELGNIIAKDYAVISRFEDLESKDIVCDGCLHDYFLAGIRGLGTWGTAWFIDRRYKQIPEAHHGENIQLLLEVVFRNDRIFDIRDVSEESSDYFINENDIRTIKTKIRELIESRHVR